MLPNRISFLKPPPSSADPLIRLLCSTRTLAFWRDPFGLTALIGTEQPDSLSFMQRVIPAKQIHLDPLLVLIITDVDEDELIFPFEERFLMVDCEAFRP